MKLENPQALLISLELDLDQLSLTIAKAKAMSVVSSDIEFGDYAFEIGSDYLGTLTGFMQHAEEIKERVQQKLQALAVYLAKVIQPDNHNGNSPEQVCPQ
jgi:hypothetical protein